MTWHFTPYSIPLIIGAVVLIPTAFLVLRRSPTLANIYMAIACILIAIFSGGYGLELAQTSLGGIYFWKKVEYLGGAAAPVFLLLLIVAYSGFERWLTRVNHLILLAIPAISIGLAWTSRHHGLIWNNPRVIQTETLYVLDYDPGWWYLVSMIYVYLMVILSVAVLLFSFFRQEGAFRKQVLLFLAGISLPMLTFGFVSVSVAMGVSLPKIEWHAYALIITGLVMAVSLLKFQVFQVGPVAYDAIFKTIGDAIVVLDDHDRVIDVNPAAAVTILNWERPAVIGKNLSGLLSSSELETLQPYLNVSEAQGEIVLGGYPLDLKITSFKNRLQKDAGRLIVMQDITQRVKAENAMRELAAHEERARLSRELHDGLGQVLGYITVQAQAVQTLLNQKELGPAQLNLQQLAQASHEAQTDLRHHLLGLRQPPDTGASPAPPKTFLDALPVYLEQFQTRYGLAVHLWPTEKPPGPLFPANVEEQATRIIQEALTNVAKHARAKRVDINFQVADGHAQITITDDGVGFALVDAVESETTPGGHYGLTIMRERAEQVGGTLEIHTAPGKGARVIITLPRLLPRAEEDAGIKGVRVVLADDHPLFLDGLRNLLAARGVTVVGLARDGLEAVEKVRALRPDMAVLDLNMPGCNGIEATRAIKAEMPEVRVVILTVPESEDFLYEAVKSGASGYLYKDLEANHFCQLLVSLLRGEEAVFSPGVAERLVSEIAQGKATPGAELSPRQWEVLELVAQGLTYKEVGAKLHLSEKTIKYHIAQILQKLHLENRAEVMAWYHRLRPEQKPFT